MGLKDQLALGAAAAAAVGLYVIWTRGKGKKDVYAKLEFQHPTSVPRSLVTTGKVYVDRSTTGSDAPSVGLEYAPKEVLLRDGRGEELSLDDNGMLFTTHEGIEGIDFYNEDDIITKYYPMMEKLIKEKTGARRVIVFDHNVRKTLSHQKQGGDKIKGGNQVQHPLQMVHGDYTLTSAPLRIKMLSDKPKTNDTLAKILKGKPVVDPSEIPGILSSRYQFINIWRSFADTPILDQPLAVCDGSSVPPSDLVVFEVRYTDRTGENYFSRHSSGHKWYHFPQMTKNEVLFLKCWDSSGRDFAHLDAAGQPSKTPTSDTVKSTFSLHTAFSDPTTPKGAPPRESIEVRTVVLY